MELSDLRQKYADKEKTVVLKNIELEKQQHILTQKLTQLEKKFIASFLYFLLIYKCNKRVI